MKRTPLLIAGLGFLGGVTLVLTRQPLFLLLLIPVLYPWRQALSITLFIFIGALYTLTTISLPNGDCKGVAKIHIQKISKGKRGWSYQGKLKSLEGAKDLPVRFYTQNRLDGGYDYQVEGQLARRGTSFQFRPSKGADWQPLDTNHSAERRFKAKQKMLDSLCHHLSRESSAFMTALVTGEITDPAIFFDFNRLGLAHLMAISGFHFSLVATLLSLFLRPLFPYKTQAILSICLLACYFAFIGLSASVLRAFVMGVMGLFALTIERKSQALNSLGCALLIVLILDPFALFSLGFQFSFLCTGSILVFYRPIERGLCCLLPSYRKEAVWKMSWLDQHGFIASSLIRKGLALGVAVNMGALPLTLYHFHTFPWISLVSNLFFPFLIAILLALLPLAYLASWLFPLTGRLLFSLEEGLVGFSLNFARNLPNFFDFRWFVSYFPLYLLLGILIILLFLLRLELSSAFSRKFVSFGRRDFLWKRKLEVEGNHFWLARPTLKAPAKKMPIEVKRIYGKKH